MPKQTVAKDAPLAEITLRRYEKPNNLGTREAIKRLCLSLGLLQAGDSRDIIVDIFQVLLEARTEKKALPAELLQNLVIEKRKQANLPLKGIAGSNIRRQVKRLRDLFLVEKNNNLYRITEFEQLSTIFEEKIKKYYLNSIIERVNDYIKAVEP
ncbi:MAG: hypothetical protein Q7R96_00390 [Nanoarchaeota archaeon]|nr:hypothetical protein [Nanoarchaeota archaeon]